MAKILLIEDNEMNRDMLSRRLQRKGYQVVTAADGQQALLHSTDFGQSWTDAIRMTPARLSAITFASPNVGIIVGERGTILRTTNGGTSWDSISSGSTTSRPSSSMSRGTNSSSCVVPRGL